MQSLPSVSVDMMSTGSSANTSAAKTGQDGAFAAHLTAASQEQTTTAQSKEALSKQESNSSPTAQASASEKEKGNNDPTDDATLDATLNGSAGAANAGIDPVRSTGAEAGLTLSPSRVQTREESAISQMLNAITLAADGTMTAAQGTGPTASTEEATTVPTFTIEAPQPLVPTDPAKASTESTGVPAQQNLGNGEGIGGIRMDTPATQPQIPVSLGAEAAVPASGDAGATGQAPSAPLLTTGQSQPSQTADQQNATQPGTDQVVQNKYGQIITIHQSTEAEEMAATTGTGGKTAGLLANSQQQDVNNNYIHSHLPNETPKTGTGNSDGQQQDATQDNQQKGAHTVEILTDGQLQSEQVSAQKPQILPGQESQPLIFAHHRTNGPLSGNTLITDSSTLRLPSGLTVPEGTVVDQMIAHFSVNKRLESGTINLKLHPQELGELRMEIKVEQDNIKAHIIAQNPQAQEMIDRHLPRLREALEQQGLHLQQIEVTVAANDHTDGERYQENTGQQHLNHSMRKGSSQPVFTLDMDEETVEAAQAATNLSVLA